jgi:hypothetical protein
MRQGDLTTIANVKAWLNITAAGADPVRDALIMRLIAGASAFVLQQVNRSSFAYGPVTRTYDGTGKDYMVLRDWPVQEIVSIGLAGQSQPITAKGSTFPWATGYVLDPPSSSPAGQRLSLIGYGFPCFRGSVNLTYMAGFAATEEYAIPAGPYGITVGQLWTADISVTTAMGVTMTNVAANPAAGQYTAIDGVYMFNVADVGTQISIRYSYVPADIEQVVCELVGLRMKAKDRIGVSSQSLAGKESISYFGSKDIGTVMTSVLLNYRPYF